MLLFLYEQEVLYNICNGSYVIVYISVNQLNPGILGEFMVNNYIEMDVNDYSEIETKVVEYVFTALCTSDQCVGTNSDKNRIGAVKRVAKHHVFCPDCEYALFWEKLPK